MVAYFVMTMYNQIKITMHLEYFMKEFICHREESILNMKISRHVGEE